MTKTSPASEREHAAKLSAASACAAADVPLPIKNLYDVVGSEASFRLWKREGLAVFWKKGSGQMVLLSVLRKFLIETGKRSQVPALLAAAGKRNRSKLVLTR